MLLTCTRTTSLSQVLSRGALALHGIARVAELGGPWHGLVLQDTQVAQCQGFSLPRCSCKELTNTALLVDPGIYYSSQGGFGEVADAGWEAQLLFH